MGATRMAKGFSRGMRTPRVKTRQPPKSYAKKFVNAAYKKLQLNKRLGPGVNSTGR